MTCALNCQWMCFCSELNELTEANKSCPFFFSPLLCEGLLLRRAFPEYGENRYAIPRSCCFFSCCCLPDHPCFSSLERSVPLLQNSFLATRSCVPFFFFSAHVDRDIPTQFVPVMPPTTLPSSLSRSFTWLFALFSPQTQRKEISSERVLFPRT